MRKTALLIACLAVVPLSAQDNNLKTTNIQRYYMPVRLFLQAAANMMPVEKYSFKIAPEQMTFGQWINHSTERNYLDCSTLRGADNPMPKAEVDKLTSKDDIVENLRKSFEYCDATFENLDDQKILASPQMVTSFLHTSVHNNEIYGNIVGYLRASGITPPSTEMIQEMMQSKRNPQEIMKEMMEKYNPR